MIKFTIDLLIGTNPIRIEETAETQLDMLRKIGFYQGLQLVPEVRNGETMPLPDDLRVSYRTPKNGKGQACIYVSLASESSGMEFNLGICNDPNKGFVFPKGWSKIQRKTVGYSEEDETGSSEFSGQHTEPIPGSMGDPNAKRPDPASSGLPDIQIRTHRARQNVEFGFISHAPKDDNKRRWLVGKAPGKIVWVDTQGNRQCSCNDLVKGRSANLDFECEHIISVALWKQQQESPATAQA